MLSQVVLERSQKYEQGPDYDGLWKNVIQELFQEFMQFFAADLSVEIDFSKDPEFLDKELFKEIIEKKEGRIDADKIVKVHLKNGESRWVLIHIEVQDRDSKGFSKRMFTYFSRIYDKFNEKVFALALMTNNQPTKHPAIFKYDFHGTKLSYAYNVYRFHEQEVAELEQSDNPFAWAVIAGIYANTKKKDAEKQYYFKSKLFRQVLTKFQGSHKQSRIYLSALFKFIDYLIITPEEYKKRIRIEVIKLMNERNGLEMMEDEVLSPTLRDVREIFREEGEEKGMLKKSFEIAERMLNLKMNKQEISLITQLSTEEIERIEQEMN